MCISRCNNKNMIRKCKLILVKLRSNDTMKYCAPCDMCSKIIDKYKFQVVEVYYEPK